MYFDDDYPSTPAELAAYAADERFHDWLVKYLSEEGYTEEEIEAYIEEGDPEDLRYVFDDEEEYNRLGPERYYGCDWR